MAATVAPMGWGFMVSGTSSSYIRRIQRNEQRNCTRTLQQLMFILSHVSRNQSIVDYSKQQ